jgi:tetratricopeptide (TPR) repeat protein
MRGTTDYTAFDTFVEATRLFPPTEQANMKATEVFQKAYGLLEGLTKSNPEFPRALAWFGYALSLTVSEGWPIDGFADGKLDLKQRLDVALERVLAARKMDETDYDLWWATANVHLIRREFDLAEEAFRQANYLNRDEVNANLEAETADAFVHLGNLNKAEKNIRRAARQPDWYHWIRAWTYFVTAGRNRAEELTFLDLSLDEIKMTFGQPGDESYILEVQLLLAAVHAAKRAVYEKMEGISEDDRKRKIERQIRATERAIARFAADFPYWDVEQAIRFAPFKNRGDEDYWRTNVTAAFAARASAP